MKKSIFTSIFLSLVMLGLLSTFIMSRYLLSNNTVLIAASTIWTMFLVFITFMIYRTGMISKYRSLFFIIYALSFILTFTAGLVEERGSMALSHEIIVKKEVPLCPVAIPQLILPAIVKKVIVFPTQLIGGSQYGGFYPILFLWLAAVIILGRGWCSWGCFYGGIDEGFSKILKKPVINSSTMNNKWRYLPFAVLILTVIASYLAMGPFYCTWLCPLKLVTEYPEINSIARYLQAIIFITLGMGLLIILPLLMKKRTQCGLFCPLGALQSLAGVINPYRVKIDTDKCSGCGKCKIVCPTFSIGDKNLKAGKASITCTKCGKCMESCPQKAIDYKLAGFPVTTNDRILSGRILGNKPSLAKRMLVLPVRFLEEVIDARTLFIFGAILFGAIISGNFVTLSLFRLYHLFTTGSILLH